MVEKQRKSEGPLEKQGTFPSLFQDLETKKLFPLFFHCFSMEKQKPSGSVTYDSTNGFGLEAFTDSNWASDRDDCKSISGYFFKLANRAVS